MAHTKVAVVTGAGSGVGRAAVLALLGDGYQVVLAGRRKDALEETVKLAGNTGANALVVPTDVTIHADIKNLFKATKDKFGRLDVLFNNAGMGAPPVPLEDLPVETWKKVVDTNLTGPFLCIQEAFRMMKAQDPKGGRIINNGSISAYAPRPYSIAYTATKHAVSGLTRTASLDGRQFDIAVGQIDIGNASTPLTARMANGVPQADGSVKVEPTMDVTHVGNALLAMANLPLDTNVLFMNIMATKMPFVGRG